MAAKVTQTNIKNFFNSDQIKLGAMFAELFGVFVITAVAVGTSSSQSGFNMLIAAVAYLVMWLAVNRLSGAHLNPGVTIGLLTLKKISPLKAGGYLIAQLLGAMLALVVLVQLFNANTSFSIAGINVFEIPAFKNQPWLPIFGELIGALIFGFGVGSVILGKKEGFEAAFTAGGALLLGFAAGSLGGIALLNPALALGAGAFSTMWAFWVYAIAPVVGIVGGIWIYKALQWEIEKGKK